MTAGNKRERLIQFLSARTSIHEAKLEDMRAQAASLRQRPDIIWLLLLQSAATMGNSRGWKGLFGDSGNSKLSTLAGFEEVSAIRSDLRESYLAPILQTANVRMATRKAEWLAEITRSFQTSAERLQHASPPSLCRPVTPRLSS